MKKLKEEDYSEKWIHFLDELDTVCHEQKVDFKEFLDWVVSSIEGIKKEEFYYHITSGRIPEFLTQKIDVNILKAKVLYDFTVTSTDKQFTITPLGLIEGYQEIVSEEFILCNFRSSSAFMFTIGNVVANSDKLRQFARKILRSAWGI